MKQETIEEVAEREGIYRASQNNFNQASAGYNAKWFKRGAIFGAKWQQERSYSKQDMIDFAYKYTDERRDQGARAMTPELLIKQFKNK